MCRQKGKERTARYEEHKSFLKKVLTFGVEFGIMAKPSRERPLQNLTKRRQGP